MKVDEFNNVVVEQLEKCTNVLIKKASEYSTEDRLHNFKQAAKLQNTTIQNAIAGMMVKHTVSVYDMCRSEESYPKALWSEKITDHINYLILLQAVLEEQDMLVKGNSRE